MFQSRSSTLSGQPGIEIKQSLRPLKPQTLGMPLIPGSGPGNSSTHFCILGEKKVQKNPLSKSIAQEDARFQAASTQHFSLSPCCHTQEHIPKMKAHRQTDKKKGFSLRPVEQVAMKDRPLRQKLTLQSDKPPP